MSGQHDVATLAGLRRLNENFRRLRGAALGVAHMFLAACVPHHPEQRADLFQFLGPIFPAMRGGGSALVEHGVMLHRTPAPQMTCCLDRPLPCARQDDGVIRDGLQQRVGAFCPSFSELSSYLAHQSL